MSGTFQSRWAHSHPCYRSHQGIFWNRDLLSKLWQVENWVQLQWTPTSNGIPRLPTAALVSLRCLISHEPRVPNQHAILHDAATTEVGAECGSKNHHLTWPTVEQNSGKSPHKYSNHIINWKRSLCCGDILEIIWRLTQLQVYRAEEPTEYWLARNIWKKALKSLCQHHKSAARRPWHCHPDAWHKECKNNQWEKSSDWALKKKKGKSRVWLTEDLECLTQLESVLDVVQ